SASMERWRKLARLAGVKWTRESLVSAEGETVAALAAHMAEALEQAARRLGAVLAADSRILASEPVKPRRRRVGMWGRSCGGRTAWRRPRSSMNFILARP